jgi:nitrate reductase delta subunit
VTRARPKPAHSKQTLTVAWQSASLLLDYPDATLVGNLAMMRAAARALPDRIGSGLGTFIDHLESTPLHELQQDYVETFDSRRRCNLFLTYFAHGDTRKRGMALLRFKQTYLQSGFELDAGSSSGGELPDHLCVVQRSISDADAT